MPTFAFHCVFTLTATLLACRTPLGASATEEPSPTHGLCRYPDISKTEIVFSYGNDLWIVPKEGGIARPVANPPGFEGSPRFSPDGKSIAFRANYDKGLDLYTLSTEGGIPQRVTHHPEPEGLCDWTPDGRSLLFSGNLSGLSSARKLYSVPAVGGLPTQLPVPYGANGSLDKTGEWLAYTPHSTDNRTWKRYRGGMATDVWLFNLKTGASRRITDWEGTDTLPMWHGRKLYYLSDRSAAEEHALNVWRYDIDSGKTEQVTRLRSHDVRWPAIGPDDGGAGELVFQHGDSIHVTDLATGATRAVPITVPGDRETLRVAPMDASKNIDGASISPSGKRVAVVARGDIWSAPAENGTPRNLTRTDGVFERNAHWSPDGKTLAFFSDATGEYELYTMPADGKSEGVPAVPRQITRPVEGQPSVFRTDITWSPDSKSVVLQDKSGNIELWKLEDGSSIRLERNPNAPAVVPVSFSSDSRWIAWSRASDSTELGALFLYDTRELDPAKARAQVTSGFYSDSKPVFDRKGDWLVFESDRNFSPSYSDFDTSWIYEKATVLMAVPLKKDFKLPTLPTSDEEAGSPEPKSDEKPDSSATAASSGKQDEGAPKSEAQADEKKDEKKVDKKEVAIDLEGFESRAVQLPVEAGSVELIGFSDQNKLLYLREDAVRVLDLGEQKPEEKSGPGGSSFSLSADGKKLLCYDSTAKTFSIADSTAGASAKPVAMKPMLVEIHPRHERQQILRDAWRIMRDYFYDEGMHGVDWVAIYRKYEAMMPGVVTREDLNYLITEMISELNVGHAYLWEAGDVEQIPSRRVGMLGVEFAAATNADGSPAKAWKLARFISGASFDQEARSPLAAQGLGVSEGDYLLAVNGEPVDPSRDPWSLFLELAGKSVTLTVSAKPVMDKDAKEVVVTTIESEANLHARAWVEAKRRRVEELSGGRIGYIYVPNTGIDGQTELVRQFFGQRTKPALLIDDRWNGGGQIPTRFIELLHRPVTNYWALRDARSMVWPPDGHHGPKAMLINGLAGSGGDMFPWLFKHNQLGPVIGTRTWGGLVGISGNPGLIDGGAITVPNFGFYEVDGTWGVEGHGIDPDIEVLDDPAQMKDGGDPQLEKGVEVLLKELETNAYKPVPKPKGPNRSGMGLPDKDK